jgi:hypothetical protein
MKPVGDAALVADEVDEDAAEAGERDDGRGTGRARRGRGAAGTALRARAVGAGLELAQQVHRAPPQAFERREQVGDRPTRQHAVTVAEGDHHRAGGAVQTVGERR